MSVRMEPLVVNLWGQVNLALLDKNGGLEELWSFLDGHLEYKRSIMQHIQHWLIPFYIIQIMEQQSLLNENRFSQSITGIWCHHREAARQGNKTLPFATESAGT